MLDILFCKKKNELNYAIHFTIEVSKNMAFIYLVIPYIKKHYSKFNSKTGIPKLSRS